MDIKDKKGLTSKFWKADAILHDYAHTVYSWATFILPSRRPKRARLAYQIVLGTSAGLYWVFKRETYPQEHVIPRTLPEPCFSVSEPSQNEQAEAVSECKQKTDEVYPVVSEEEQAYGSEIPEIKESFVQIIREAFHDASSGFNSNSPVKATLTPSSTGRLHDFPDIDIESGRLSPTLMALQVKGEKFVDKHTQVLDWLDLAISERQENEGSHGVPSYKDWQAGVANETVIVEYEADSDKSEAFAPLADQAISAPLLTSEREEINLDSAFGMGATDLEDDEQQAELDVDVSKIIKDSPEFHIYIAKLERARQATFVGARGQIPQQKPLLQPYILGDVVAQASEVFGKLPKERWNAEGWAYATGFIKYSYLSAAHDYHSDNGYYQRPRLEASERSCNWFGVSSIEHARHPHNPPLYPTEEVPGQPEDDSVLVSIPYHHENYLTYPVEDKTSTPPEVSLWVTHLARRRKATFDPLSRRGVLAAQATKTVDPYQYNGPQEFLNIYSGTQLRNAIVGYVNKVYMPRGSWQYWEYQDEAAPMLPSDVAWFTNAEDGYEGMQLPYFVDPRDSRDMIVNGDCGIHGPAKRAFPFGEKGRAYFCGSPLRYELWNSDNSRVDGIEVKPSVVHMPSIAEEEEDEEPNHTAAHMPSMAEAMHGGPNEPVQAHSPEILEEVAPVEQPMESRPFELDGLSEEAISLENDDFYGTSIVAPEHISSFAGADEETQGWESSSDGPPLIPGDDSEEYVVFDENVGDDEASTIFEPEQGVVSPTHYIHRPITSLVSGYDTSLLGSENETIHCHGDDQGSAHITSDDRSGEDDVEWDTVPLSSETSSLEKIEPASPVESKEDKFILISAPSRDDNSSSGKDTAYLARFSKDIVKPHSENPKEDYLAKWVDDVSDTSGIMGHYGYITHDDFQCRLSEDPEMAIQSSLWRAEINEGTPDVGKGKNAERALEDIPKGEEVDNASKMPCGSDDVLPAPSERNAHHDISVEDRAMDTNDDSLDLEESSTPESTSQARSSTPDDQTSSSGGTSSPPRSNVSGATTPDYNLDIDLEISILQERLGELYAIKAASQYPTLDQFEQEHLAAEYRPLLPTAGDRTPPAVKVITGILAQASQHPELDEYLDGLTTAMAFKGLRAPTPEPVAVNPNDFEGFEEAPMPDSFLMVNPDMHFEAEKARLAENRAADAAAGAARGAEVLETSQTLTDTELEAAAAANELQDLEDNAAINGGQTIFKPVNVDVAWQPAIRVAPVVPVVAPVINEEQPVAPAEDTVAVVEEELRTVTAVPVVVRAPARYTVPTLVYANYSDILELESAPSFDEYLYGTADYGIGRKVKKLSAKLKFWGRVRSGKLDLGA